MDSNPFFFYAKQINAARGSDVTEAEVISAFASYVARKGHDYYMTFLDGRRYLESEDREGIAQIVFLNRDRELKGVREERDIFRPAVLHYSCQKTGVKFTICIFSQEQRELCIKEMYSRLGQNARYAITDM